LHASQPLVVKGNSGCDCTQLKAVGTDHTTPHIHFVTIAAGNEVKNVASTPLLMPSSTKPDSV